MSTSICNQLIRGRQLLNVIPNVMKSYCFPGAVLARHIHLLKHGVQEPEQFEDNDQLKNLNSSVITIPVRLKKKLQERKERLNSKYAERQRIIAASRQGSKSRLVISCKRQEFNHYYGQSYGKKGDEVPLASKGWGHHKAAGDMFTINPSSRNLALLEPDAGITFEKLGVCDTFIEKLNDENIDIPTVIQASAIPEVIRGSNCVLAAETGCGKTLAYLIPMLQEILLMKNSRRNNRGKNQPQAIVLAPTRELAEQIFGVAKLFTADTGILVKLFQGGNLGSKISNPPSEEIDLIVSTVNVIATLSHLKVYDMSRVKQIALDEADTLLDDSFSPSVINFLTPFTFEGNEECRVQLILVSATIPRSVESILEDVFPVDSFVRVLTPGLHQVMAHVPQKFMRLKKSEKVPKLIEIARAEYEAKNSMMIFCNATDTCEWLSRYLMENGIKCLELHGHIRPQLRKGRIDIFKSGEAEIICCTDIASRGIDTLVTGHVFNFDFPRYLADYIHRCGRTGRVGSKVPGKVTNVITRRSEIPLVNEIESSVRNRTSLQRVNANIKRLLNARYGMYQPIRPAE